MARLLIVTVNFRTPALTLECIASVAAERAALPPLRMVIVDNASGDGSLAQIRAGVQARGWGDWCEVVDGGRNGGFSFGNNVAIRPAMASPEPPDFIWLLNPDAKLIRDGGRALVDFLVAHPRAGMATSSSLDAQGHRQTMAFRRFTALGEFVGTMKLGVLDRLFAPTVVPMAPRDEPHAADWLSGCSLMIRREVIEQIGLMDESYFLYFEESDYCLQARRKGWELWYVPQSTIFHAIGAATGLNDGTAHAPRKPSRRPAYWFESRRRYFVKNFGAGYAALADAAHMIGFALWRLRRWVQRKPDLDPPHYLADFLRHSVFAAGFRA